MKSIFIISAYPNNKKSLDTLKLCIFSAREFGFDILVTTNYPITDPEIYDLADFVVWDKTDIQSMTDYNVFPSWGWIMECNSFKVTTSFDNAYHFDLHRALKNGVNIARGLGYEFFYYLEGDCIIKDTRALIDTRDRMFKENKKLFFMEAKMTGKDGGYYMCYTTHLFGGVPEFFLSRSKSIPTDINEWAKNEDMYRNGMEVIFYETLKPFKDETLVLEYGSLDHAINYNIIQKVNSFGFKNMFFFQDGVDDYIYLVIHNRSDKDIDNIELLVDGNHWMNLELGPSAYHMNKIVLEDLKGKVVKEILNINDEVYIYEKNLSDKNIEILKRSNKYIPK